MADESKLRVQHNRGIRAKEILDEPLVKEAFDKIEAQIMDGWRQSAGDEKDVRERAYLMYRLLQNFQGHFKQIVNTGEAAKRELLEIEKESRLKRAFKR